MSKIPGFDSNRHNVTTARPRLLGSRDYLQKLARERPEELQRVLRQAGPETRPAAARPAATGPAASRPASTRPRRRRNVDGFYDVNARVLALGIEYVLNGDKKKARTAVDLVLKHYIDEKIEAGHVTFAHSMARCALAYDLCHDLWTPDERGRFSKYVHDTIAANVNSEPSVFHNGWYGYKHWGYGMAGYALWHDDPAAPTIIEKLHRDYLDLAVPALKLAGDGGGWGEGFYIHYWIVEWLMYCETARMCEGVDYYAAAPEFYRHRAIASMFENFPPLQKGSHQPIPMGDGHGRRINNERDKELGARRILVNYHRDDPDHQVVHAYNLQTPKTTFGVNAYMDFLWNDKSVKAGDLDSFRLSHVSRGPGFVYARSSWKEDATHFFFKCGPRFTAHQHLDNGQFGIFRHQELACDGGHYDTFETAHALNYYIRTIAHNSILVYDPHEKWPQWKAPKTPRGIRSIPLPTANDGGQYYPWSASSIGPNGGALTVVDWTANKEIMAIGELAAAKDHGNYLYCAGDFTKSYSPHKVKSVTRQIAYVRPGTFIIFDRVEAKSAKYRKAFLLQCAKPPQQVGPHWVITNGEGRLFVQTLEPSQRNVDLYKGGALYSYNGQNFPPQYLDPPAAECRMEISPAKANKSDHFLHVLTATDANTDTVPLATSRVDGNDLVVTLGGLTIRFALKESR
jgi:heparin/heparan-sulfate lyase